MIKVLFFAQTKELLKTAELTLELSSLGDAPMVGALRHFLQQKGEKWQAALSSQQALVAINQSMCQDSHLLKSGDEVAFFPPVTGG